jgi:hypothetical protein
VEKMKHRNLALTSIEEFYFKKYKNNNYNYLFDDLLRFLDNDKSEEILYYIISNNDLGDYFIMDFLNLLNYFTVYFITQEILKNLTDEELNNFTKEYIEEE